MSYVARLSKRTKVSGERCEICDEVVTNLTFARLENAKCLTEDLVRALAAVSAHVKSAEAHLVVCKKPQRIQLQGQWHTPRSWSNHAGDAANLIQTWKQTGVPLSAKYYIHAHHSTDLGPFLQSHHNISTHVLLHDYQQEAIVDEESAEHVESSSNVSFPETRCRQPGSSKNEFFKQASVLADRTLPSEHPEQHDGHSRQETDSDSVLADRSLPSGNPRQHDGHSRRETDSGSDFFQERVDEDFRSDLGMLDIFLNINMFTFGVDSFKDVRRYGNFFPVLSFPDPTPFPYFPVPSPPHSRAFPFHFVFPYFPVRPLGHSRPVPSVRESMGKRDSRGFSRTTHIFGG